jgi:hypothetical protein
LRCHTGPSFCRHQGRRHPQPSTGRYSPESQRQLHGGGCTAVAVDRVPVSGVHDRGVCGGGGRVVGLRASAGDRFGCTFRGAQRGFGRYSRRVAPSRANGRSEFDSRSVRLNRKTLKSRTKTRLDNFEPHLHPIFFVCAKQGRANSPILLGFF